MARMGLIADGDSAFSPMAVSARRPILRRKSQLPKEAAMSTIQALDSAVGRPQLDDSGPMHPVYLPFSEAELAERFAAVAANKGEAARQARIAYYRDRIASAPALSRESPNFLQVRLPKSLVS